MKVTKGRISEYETGVRSLTPLMLTRACEALGCEPAILAPRQ
jgi:transcriptional regulator with XRE-family HTH domain